MTRHDALPAQIATLPLRPAQHLAPPAGKIITTRPLGHICNGKVQIKGLYIASYDPDMASPPLSVVSPRTGQIQKNP
jgi:hypothetical protein